MVLCVAPSHVVRRVAGAAAGAVARGALCVSASKGLEPGSLRLTSEVLAECLPGTRVAALSGPSFAREVYERQPTAVAAASTDDSAVA